MKNFFSLVILFFATTLFLIAQKSDRPNVVIIMTDDQGIGDFGFMGNPYIETPTLDQLATESIHMTNFYVSPVCAPTRSSLMTGRYSLRTGVHDTYNGGAMMAGSEITIAEYFKEAGYTTGIFGKWHLGDNYPMRPSDQGFDESLIHKSGGIGQVGDLDNYFAFDSSYFDPVLFRNNERIQTQGYCSDVFTDGALGFVEENRDSPFLLYLAFNAPHTPLQVPQKYLDRYEDLSQKINAESNADFFPNKLSDKQLDDAKRVYAMVTNIDDNISRLIETLKAQGIYDDTIIVFLTDNGPQQNRYKAGFRGLKSSVYEGGVRVPLLIRYPRLGTRKVSTNLAHFDIMPTLMDLAGLNPPDDVDGSSFASILMGEGDDSSFQDRPLFLYWRRGFPEAYQNVAVIKGDYKWVAQQDEDVPISESMLFNLKNSENESKNSIESEPEAALNLKDEFDLWLQEMRLSPNLLEPVRIGIGSEEEPTTILNRNDAGGMPGIWAQDELFGYWSVEVLNSGYYDVQIKFLNLVKDGRVLFKIAPTQVSKGVDESGKKTVEFSRVYLQEGKYQLESWFDRRANERLDQKGGIVFPFSLEVSRVK